MRGRNRCARSLPLSRGCDGRQLALDLARDLPDAVCEARHHFGELLVRGRERRREQALVARVAVACRLRREDHEPALEREVVQAAGDAQLERQVRLAVARVDVLDAEQKAVAAYLADEV